MSPPLDLEHGQDDEGTAEKPKRGPGRPRKTEALGDLEKEVREQLGELAEWFRQRDPEFAETFLEDVPRIAKFLTARAGKHERLARLLRIVFAADGPLAGLRAFGRTARKALGLLAAARARGEDDGTWIDDDGNHRGPDGQVIVPGT